MTQTVYLVILTCDHGQGSFDPSVTVYTSRESARKALKVLLAEEKKTGILEKMNDPKECNYWEIHRNEDDWFLAKDDSACKWFDIRIEEAVVNE